MSTINPVKFQSTINYSKPKTNVSFKKDETKNEAEKSNKLPALLLTTAALGLGVFGYVKLKKSDNAFFEKNLKSLEQAQTYLKNIFGKDYTIDETKNILDRYKELDSIADNKEFLNKLFEQLKKDFKAENKNLSLEIWDNAKPVDNGVFRGYTEALSRKIGVANLPNRLDAVESIFHEFRHIKQNELMYRTDRARLAMQKVVELEKSNNQSYQKILRNAGGDKEKARKVILEEVETVYQENWGHLQPLSKDSAEYSMGLKYLENEENRIPAGDDYYKQILEKEAKFVGENAKKLFNIFKK